MLSALEPGAFRPINIRQIPRAHVTTITHMHVNRLSNNDKDIQSVVFMSMVTVTYFLYKT